MNFNLYCVPSYILEKKEVILYFSLFFFFAAWVLTVTYVGSSASLWFGFGCEITGLQESLKSVRVVQVIVGMVQSVNRLLGWWLLHLAGVAAVGWHLPMVWIWEHS